MLNRPIEFWVALMAGALLVYVRHKDQRFVHRLIITVISSGIGFSLHEDVAAWSGRSETLVVMILTAFGYTVFNALGALFADKDFIRELLLRKFGGASDGKHKTRPARKLWRLQSHALAGACLGIFSNPGNDMVSCRWEN